MIDDKLFKRLEHNIDGYKKYTNGQQISKGYKPDYVLRNTKDENDFIIMESENNSNRKMFIGCMIKAAYFLQNEKKGKLIIIMNPKNNTKVESIANLIKTYFNWIKNQTNMTNVYVISSNDYFKNGKVLSLDSSEFLHCAIKI